MSDRPTIGLVPSVAEWFREVGIQSENAGRYADVGNAIVQSLSANQISCYSIGDLAGSVSDYVTQRSVIRELENPGFRSSRAPGVSDPDQSDPRGGG